jgi:uncharacterized membrane protein
MSTLEPATNIESAKNVTTLVYAMQAAAFLVGITFIVAIVINYVKQEDVAGTWLASHFRWQMRTFWFALLWGVLGFITTFVVVGFAVLLANTVWIIYRIAKGWLWLNEGREMYR